MSQYATHSVQKPDKYIKHDLCAACSSLQQARTGQEESSYTQ